MDTKPNDDFARAWDESIQAESGAGKGTTSQANEQRADSAPDGLKGQEGSTASDAASQKADSKPSSDSAVDKSAAPSSATQRADTQPGDGNVGKEPKSNDALANEQRKDSEPTKQGQDGSTTQDANSQKADSAPDKVETSTPASRGPGGASDLKTGYDAERAEYEAAYAVWAKEDEKKA